MGVFLSKGNSGTSFLINPKPIAFQIIELEQELKTIAIQDSYPRNSKYFFCFNDMTVAAKELKRLCERCEYSTAAKLALLDALACLSFGRPEASIKSINCNLNQFGTYSVVKKKQMEIIRDFLGNAIKRGVRVANHR